MEENNLNSTENRNNSKNYYADSQKKYNAKNKIYSIKFLGSSENEMIEILENAILKSGLSSQKYIKIAIAEKLQRAGFLE